MKFLVSIHAYDCLDNVNYSAQVRRYGDYEDGPSEVALSHVGSFRGEGLDDAKDWLRDVLVELMETI